MEILLLLLFLQVKHYYADFVIQTYQQTVHKGIYRDPIGISHTLDHIYASLLALLAFHLLVLPLAPLAIMIAAVVEGIAHYHIDWIKVRFGIKDQTKPLFWNQFGQDQLAHQITYLGMVVYLVR